MIELLILALLVWLWVIERRLTALSLSENTHKLDIDGLRIEVAKLRAPPTDAPTDAPAPAAVVEPPRSAAIG